jgi:hypothetical protein
MRHHIPLRPRFSTLSPLAVALIIGACSGGGGGGEGPTSPPPPMTNPGSATFRLVGGGQDSTLSYTNGANLVFCRRQAGWADLWIRFAERSAGNGESGPHLDIDLCNHGQGGTFTAKDPQVSVCGGGQTWDVFWHGEGETFANRITAPSCTLSLTRDGTRLAGTFSCQDLMELAGGARTLDLLDGSFQCVEE